MLGGSMSITRQLRGCLAAGDPDLLPIESPLPHHEAMCKNSASFPGGSQHNSVKLGRITDE